jgi:hypothetical protein
MSARSPAQDLKRLQEQADLLGTPPSRTYSCISTERIMRAVEQQRRVSQQLEDLQARQQERNAFLRVTVPMLVISIILLLGILIIIFLVLFFFQPELLMRVLGLLSDSIAAFVVVIMHIKAAWALIPENSWLLSTAALAVVLMMGMWLRLMRSPRGV